MKNICLLFLLLIFSSVSAQTNVSGGIYNNVTWALSGSPYIVTGNIVVFPGKTLTIEPGVEVRVQGNGYPNSMGISIEIRGMLVAVGTANAPITFKADGLVTDPYSWSGVFVKTSQGGDANFDYINVSNAYTAILSDQFSVRPGITTLHNCNFTDNQFGPSPWFTARFVDCNFTGNNAAVQPMGAYGIGLELLRCNFDSNQVAFPYVFDTVTVDSCSFVNNNTPIISLQGGSVSNSLFQGNFIAFSGYGARVDNCQFINNGTAISNFASGSLANCMIRYNQIGVEITGEAEMTNNDVSSNVVGVKIYDNVAGFTGNRICANSQFNVENAADKNISLVNNCFCESDSTIAEQLLFDGYDDITRGLFNYALYDSSCTNILQLVSKVLIPTAIGDVRELTIEVFPNPSSEYLHVRLPFSTHPVKARILNLQGVELMKVDMRSETTFGVGELPQGIYLLEIVGAKRLVRTWVKQ
jgi:hypothetical protein